jgi:hypothetical protein
MYSESKKVSLPFSLALNRSIISFRSSNNYTLKAPPSPLY